MLQWPLHRQANASGQARSSRRAGPDKSSYNNIGRAIAENRQMNASKAKPFVLVITPNNFCSKVAEKTLEASSLAGRQELQMPKMIDYCSVQYRELLPPSMNDNGVKMICTNEKCTYTKQLVHAECFELLEETLLKMISTIGSARGWTDTQRRHNLWEKKGLTLVQKRLRCHCGLGLMVRDGEFYKKNSIQNTSGEGVLTSPMDAKNKKKKKKELPKLNFGYNISVIPPAENAENYKKKFSELDSHFLSSYRNTSSDDGEWSVVSIELGSIPNGHMRRDTSSYGNSKRSDTSSPAYLSYKSAITATPEPMNVSPPTPSIWKTIPSAAPVPIVPTPTKHAQAKIFTSPQDMLPTIDMQTKKAEVNQEQASWTSIVQSSRLGEQMNNNKNVESRRRQGLDGLSDSAQRTCYTLFGSDAPNFLLGERIMADSYIALKKSIS
ncbi:headcase protein family like domain-containing protein [Ditylenchus destructor]|uniref:Headcase protein family like domain-containing protein n=1 Tax=Ditylenchus destructor TaxID=166010 RepID=A0AAD4RAQ9_9BILA|nr:headcase protein family like domain-containing protein [Ditylenchus destructor]